MTTADILTEPEHSIHPDRDDARHDDDIARRTRHVVVKPGTPTMSEIYAPGGIAERARATIRAEKDRQP